MGLGVQFLSSIVILNQYFSKRRSIAVGVSQAGISVGVISMSFLIQQLMREYGWRGMVLILGGICLNTAVGGSLYRPLDDNIENVRRRRLFTRLNRVREQRQADSIARTQSATQLNGSASADDSQLELDRNTNPKPNGRRATRYYQKKTQPARRKSLPNLEPTEGTHDASSMTSLARSDVSAGAGRRFSQLSLISGSHVRERASKRRRVSVYVMAGEGHDTARMRVEVEPDTDAHSSLLAHAVTVVRKSLDFSLVADPAFLLLLIQGFFSHWALSTFYAHNVNRAIVNGVPKERLATLTTSTGIASGTCRVLSGFVGNIKGVHPTVFMAVGIAAMGVAQVAYSFQYTFYGMVACTLAFGASVGTVYTIDMIYIIQILVSDVLFLQAPS